MKKIISRIIVIKEVHSFLFKYAAVILAFGLTTLLGGVNTLAPLEDEIYEKFYESEAQVKILNIKENSDEAEKILANARLESAKHSMGMIQNMASMTLSIYNLCMTLFYTLFILATLHWILFTFQKDYFTDS